MRLPRLLVFSSLVCLGAVGARGEPLVKDSPFLPPNEPANPAPVAQAASHEFTGVIVTGKNVLINLTDASAKRSFWIGVGKKNETVELMSYDPKTETISVRLNQETLTLALKQPAVAASSGSTVATVPVAPAVPIPPPSSPAEAEREARMLVSDLLEIGIQQRKAYEEAQRKAAQEAAQKAAAKAQR